MNILAVGCHPDDLEIGCGGTLAKYTNLNNTVVMCHITNGDKGHMMIMPDELRNIRIREAEESGKVIGSREVINLDIADLEVDAQNQSIVRKLIDIIRYVKPDIIITHDPDDYMKDHRETSRIVFDASFASATPHMFTEYPYYPNIVPIYYMDTLAGINFQPDEYVNITQMINIKLKALSCHESQIKWMLEHDMIDFIDFVRTISKFRGLQSGCGYAEGFRVCKSWPRIITNRLLP